jgi:hypothetical protein
MRKQTGISSIPGVYNLSARYASRERPTTSRSPRSGPLQLLRFVVLSNDFFRALSIEALRPLHGLDIFSKLALCLTGPPNRQVAFEDVVDLFQGATGGFWVGEEDVERHRCAKHAEDNVWSECQFRTDFWSLLEFTHMSSTGCW